MSDYGVRRHSTFLERWSRHLKPLRDALRKTDLHGYKHLIEPNRVLLDRSIWFFVLLGFLVASVYAMVGSILEFLDAPMAISLMPVRGSVKDIPFPAITVCHPSRLSYKRLVNYTNFVFNNQNKTSEVVGQTWNETFNIVKSFIYLIDNSKPNDFSDLIKLHNMLTDYYNGPYPIQSILQSLAPACEEVLEACFWQDKRVNCSVVFQSRRTYIHHCCVFNYNRPTVQQFWQETPCF